eukprot:GFUD01071221.1.p1 GENE.GFUD01071221.1~~GFUD01071221.1.p1  ORF type:complete len:299 (-),score=117.54 GFUD01071221.1:88-945(-)
MELATFNTPAEGFRLTQAMSEAFQQHGFILVKDMFSKEEMELLLECFHTEEFRDKVFTRSDGGERGFQMALWWEPGNDTVGLVTRSRRVVETMRDLLGGQELYHLSSKLIMKSPKSGGAFAWHQDYGYFYENGILFPDCGSVSIPLDPCYRENGCLQIIPGSHKLGRLDHRKKGDLASVDTERLEEIIKVLGEPVMAETEPGDVLFFHSNLLHTSGPNISPDKRWNLVLAFNQTSNQPYHERFLPPVSKLEMVEDAMILSNHTKQSTIDKRFIENRQDDSVDNLN